MNFIKLKELRGQKNYTQQQIVDKLKIELRTYQSYEQGKRNPKLQMIKKIATILGCTTDELI